DVGQDRLRPADVDVLGFGAARFEHRDRVLRVLDVQAEVADTQRPSVRGLQLHERVLADLDIDELHLLRLRVNESERFGEAHRLGVELDRLVEIGNDDADMIEPDDALVGAEARLGNRRGDCDPRESTGNEESKAAHINLLLSWKPLSGPPSSTSP